MRLASPEKGRDPVRTALRARWRLGLLVLAIAPLITSCDGALDPHSPQASRIADVWWIMLAFSIVIFALVAGLLAYGLVHRRRADPDATGDHARFILAGGVALPVVVLTILMGLTVWGLQGLTEAAPAGSLQVNVTGHDWWWEVEYPASGVRTANEIHIPAGQDIEVSGTSADVIHSFWSPRLNGKMDLIPGKTNSFAIRANNVGTYRGQCAEFCGIAHANMAFYIVVQSPSDFDAWLKAQAQPAVSALDARADAGRRVFFGQSCSSCHGIAGTQAQGTAGPDLTHLASRDTFAGGMQQLNAANLYDWIQAPDDLKPGANMPPTSLSASDMNDLIAYLMALH